MKTMRELLTLVEQTSLGKSESRGTMISGKDQAMHTSVFFESPQLVKPVNWNLDDRKANLVRAEAFQKHKPEVFREFPGAKLLVLAGNVGGQIGLISERTGLLEYYVHYETSRLPGLGSCATQVKLWRSNLATVRGLAALGFDQILLQRFDSIVSDVAQTDRGREFWEGQLAHYASSKSVGFLHGSEAACYDGSVPIAEWVAQQDGWGKERRYRHRRFFISNLPAAKISQ